MSIDEFEIWCDSQNIKYFHVTYHSFGAGTAFRIDIKDFCNSKYGFNIISIDGIREFYTTNKYKDIDIRRKDETYCIDFTYEYLKDGISDEDSIYCMDLKKMLSNVIEQKEYLESFK